MVRIRNRNLLCIFYALWFFISYILILLIGIGIQFFSGIRDRRLSLGCVFNQLIVLEANFLLA